MLAYSAYYKTSNSGTAEHSGTVAEKLNLTRNTSGTPWKNGTIQNEEQL